VIEEHKSDAAEPIDRREIERAFAFACESHAGQERKSGEDFITHPLGVARICAGLRLDTATLCAALLHDTVEDTSANLAEVREAFGDEIAQLVDGVTKLTGITFKSRDERQAENYRKMMVAMATDVRVILIKLADRLHNMRTISALPKQKQQEKARETLEIFAPLAHRLGIHAIKWELEDLAFATLHPRKYDEIKELVAQQRAERERYVEEAGQFLAEELKKVGIDAEISGRAKHFYSIYTKMTRKGREFNEIFDLTAMRVLVGSVKDCYGAIGIVHSLWKPLPGRFKDFIAMPKANAYQALHTTVIGPEGRPLEIQIRTPEMHELAEYGIAAHVIYKEGGPERGPKEKMTWLRQLLENEQHQGPKAFLEALKVDLFEDEVFVFTPKGEVKNLAAGSTPLDFAYSIHTDVGHRCVGAKVNGKIVPLHYQLRSGDIVEVLTAKQGRGPSRDWLKLVRTSRARNKIRAWFSREGREDAEHKGREELAQTFKKQGLPYQKLAGSPLLVDVIREMGFRKADDFYIALGQSKISTKVVTNKVMQRLKRGEAVEEEPAEGLIKGTDEARRRTKEATSFGIKVKGIDDVVVRLAKCCRPVPGDDIVGYVSLGRGITVHREDCRNVAALKKAPERFTEVSWDGDNESSYRVELQVDAWDRTRLLEDLSRTFAEAGLNILEARCATKHPMVKNRFVVEVGDTEQLKQCISRLRNVDSVFDAYRVTPTG
jgi:GTP diphosphokinase / guanosine-3',5'-bis(diphosphate) 3'-diphosphatase